MRFPLLWSLLSASASLISATILENGQERLNPWPGQASNISLDDSWRNYDADASEISYKGRWDSKKIGWWSAPGIKTEFTGDRLAVSFGEHTTDGVLVAYRIGSLDWLFSNVTARSTYQFVSPETDMGGIPAGDPKIFELRAQIAGVSVASDAHLSKVEPFKKKVEIIGGSLASGQYGTYETLSSWSWLYGAGLGNVEFTITAYPGVCLADMKCYGGDVHGMPWWWHRASDPGSRAGSMYDQDPEEYDVRGEQPADLVIIQMGGNDHREPNKVPGSDFYHDYVRLIDDVHSVWPKAVVVIMTQWSVWEKRGTQYVPTSIYDEEIKRVHDHYKDKGFVHWFDTAGILQHNDINPKNHPTDVGHVKIASHLLQWTRLIMRWPLEPTGEVQHGTLYWNDMQEY
ncbi:hypothetical protein EYZ11_002789 [Aspergillus tanneri]|uniref:SGNH hydrolase-type esterase domain-containing protein n=1 Tax=Aspergillus tanneri TaxID=1220188 RepID=A0A4S3JQ19_9EURO|nr:uncharacterized protein ATNIH1004_008613 [Aspergillus tanneri]KAA8644409.1 hypothetical protein ATNIH1004_008613 [Aspergillus tanneri]THC97742.1 hypothetical protein EYZ11_002789 [Aspergillus tanneri]